MIVDEARFIKNKSSQRSQHVLEPSERIRARNGNALLMALTGTPLINDIEDFRAIWQFLGWIDDTKPRHALMAALEQTGLTPADRGVLRGRACHSSSSSASSGGERSTSLPTSRLAASRTRRSSSMPRPAARSGPRSRNWPVASSPGNNVFTVMRRIIGQAKAGLAADYAAQLGRSVGKVVFFAKHKDVMDEAEQTFARRDVGYASIRGDQTPKVRRANIEAFLTDPEVSVVVCSLTAVGVGLNLQVASNDVLAELSWTSAEQTQAMDRVHRIGQTEPVTAWRIIAAQTIDPKLAQLVDDKAGLAARALDGSDEDVGSSADVQLEALVALLTEALEAGADAPSTGSV